MGWKGTSAVAEFGKSSWGAFRGSSWGGTFLLHLLSINVDFGETRAAMDVTMTDGPQDEISPAQVRRECLI